MFLWPARMGNDILEWGMRTWKEKENETVAFPWPERQGRRVAETATTMAWESVLFQNSRYFLPRRLIYCLFWYNEIRKKNAMIDFWLHHKIWNAIKIESKWLGTKLKNQRTALLPLCVWLASRRSELSAICCFPSSLKQTLELTRLGNHLELYQFLAQRIKPLHCACVA